MEMAPAVLIVPARSPAVPARVLVCSEKLPTVPTVGADPLMASPWVKFWLKLKEFPAVFWVTSNAGIAPTPELIVNEPSPSVTALPPDGV